MPPTPRRIVRRAVMVIAVVVLLVSGYVSAWLVMPFAASKGVISFETKIALEPAFEPVESYAADDSNLGATQLWQLWEAVNGPRQLPPAFY